jgi:YfaZ precursor
MLLRPFIAVLAVTFISSGTLLAEEAPPIMQPTAEVALSNDTLQLRYLTSGDKVGAGRSQVSGGFFLSEDRDIVLDGALLYPLDFDLDLGPVGPLTILIGPRAYAALLQDENSDIMALSVGARIRFDILRDIGLAIVGDAFYAPDILTFGSADNLTDLSARAEIGLGPQLTGFVGMRWFEFDLTEGQGERTLQEEAFVGVAWRFQ